MKGFILAAGFGERLRPVTGSMPKALVPVCNLPALLYALMLLREAGIEEVIINLHYRRREIMEYLHDHRDFGFTISLSVEDEILGTGGGVKKCERLLSDSGFVIVNSDVITDVRLNDVISRHRALESPATIVLKKVDDGPVVVDGNTTVDFKNTLNTGLKGTHDYTGIAVLSPLILQYLKKDPSSIVYTGYTDMVRFHRLSYYEHEGLWCDIGTTETLWKANMSVLDRLSNFSMRMRESLGISIEPVSADANIDSSVSVQNSVIGTGTSITGKSVIRRSVVLPCSSIRGDAVIDNAIIHGKHRLGPFKYH